MLPCFQDSELRSPRRTRLSELLGPTLGGLLTLLQIAVQKGLIRELKCLGRGLIFAPTGADRYDKYQNKL